MTSREKFEAWARREGFDLTRSLGEPSTYLSHTTNMARIGWNAALDSLDVEAAISEIDNAKRQMPALKGIGELADHWTDENEGEMADCLTGVREALDAARAILAAAKGTS